MAVQAGSSSKLNIVTGYASTVRITESDKKKYASTVYPAGILLHDDSAKIYHADGTKSLQQLLEHPIIDSAQEVLTAAERKMIKDFNKSGGFVATNDNNKIDDLQLNVVQDGKIVESYLSEYIEDGMIKLDVLPMDVRAHMKYVATYDDLDNATEEQKHGMIFVIDASGDPTVKSGWAIYVWDKTKKDGTEAEGDDTPPNGDWVKIQEGEGIDFDYESITTHDSVEKVGAVMYDHIVFLQSPTLDQLADLEPPKVSPVFTQFSTKINDYDKQDVPLNLRITEQYATDGEHKVEFTVAESASVVIKGFEDGNCTDGQPKTLTGTDAADLNTKLAKLTLTTGATGGTFTMSLDDGYDTKEVTVTVKPFIEPTLKGTDDLKAVPTLDTDFPVRLSTAGVDPDKQFTVTVTPNSGVSMKNDTNSEVSSGSAWELTNKTVAEINAALAKGKVVNDTDGGTVNVAITGGATKDVNITTIWKDPVIEATSDKVIAADAAEVALGVSLSTANIETSKQHKVSIVSKTLKMKNDTSDVAVGVPITFDNKTVADINTALAKVKVVGATAGGKVTVTLDDAFTKELTVAIA